LDKPISPETLNQMAVAGEDTAGSSTPSTAAVPLCSNRKTAAAAADTQANAAPHDTAEQLEKQ
jgi:hypothetical protein